MEGGGKASNAGRGWMGEGFGVGARLKRRRVHPQPQPLGSPAHQPTGTTHRPVTPACSE
jgi:hypothetical protein